MSKRNMKKIVMAITTAAVVAGTAVSNVIPVFAEPGEESAGSIVVGEGEIMLDTADSDMLQEELDSLEAELPDTSRQTYYGTARKNRLNSKGIINYANGAVVIDSSDFAYLADEIDMLESAYKANMVSALNAVSTFFLADGSITHGPDDKGISDAEAVRLSFDTIISGILQSQSVDHLAEQGIAGAIEDNISKGAAAWVNGELVIGNGVDNDTYYRQGFIDGQLSIYDKVSVSYVYHEHTGNATGTTVYTETDPGGCYAAAGHTHNAITTCSASTADTGPCSDTHFEYGCWEHDTITGGEADGDGCWICNECGRHYRGWSGSASWTCDNPHYTEEYTCGSPVNTWKIDCGKVPGVTIESATIVFSD